MGTRNSGRQNEDALKTAALASGAKADASIDAAEKVDPLTQRRRDYVTKILSWRDDGKPLDVREFPDQTGMALYSDAKRVTDAGRVGQGYGTLSDGANPTYSAALDKELEQERSLEASGRLDQYVTNALAGADAEAGNLGSAATAQRMQIAGMRSGNYNAAQDRYVNYLMRPKQPSFLKQLALGFMQNGVTAATMLAGGGGMPAIHGGSSIGSGGKFTGG